MLAASIFHFGTFTIAQAKAHLKRAGIPVRDPMPPGYKARPCNNSFPRRTASAADRAVVPVKGASMGQNNNGDVAVLARLFEAIEDRRGGDPTVSRTARLFAQGRKKIAQKLGEEAIEARWKARRTIARS